MRILFHFLFNFYANDPVARTTLPARCTCFCVRRLGRTGAVVDILRVGGLSGTSYGSNLYKTYSDPQ